MHATETGIGPALQEARQYLGKSLDEASRDTRIRSQYLEALEAEDFGALPGKVYVRGFLRSYSSYLGLDPDKVIAAYDGAEAEPAPRRRPEPVPLVDHKGIPVLRRRANWKLAAGLALVVIVVFGAVGLLSRKSPVPKTGAVPPGGAQTQQVTPPTVAIELRSPSKPKTPVHLVVVVDGARSFNGMLKPGRFAEFTGESLIRVQATPGGILDFVVNGHDMGTPGSRTGTFHVTFSPQDFRGTPSASG